MRGRWILWALVAACLVHGTFVLGYPRDAPDRQHISDALQLLVESLAACAIWTAILGRRGTPASPAGVVMGLAATSYAVGTAYLVYLDFIAQPLTYPSVGDLFWLGYPVLATVALLWQARLSSRSGWLIGLLDAVTAGIAVFLLAWTLWVSRILSRTDGPLLGQVVTLGYPLGDVLVLTALLTLAARIGPAGWRRFGPMLAGAGVILVTDLYYTWRTLGGDFSTVGIPEFLWPAGIAVLAWGVWRSQEVDSTPPLRELTLFERCLPYVIALPALVSIVYADLVRQDLSPTARLVVFVWVALLLLRQFLFVTEVRKATIQLTEERLRAAQAEHEAKAFHDMADYKTDFINMAAHELSTPLTPIKLGMAKLKRMDLPDNGKEIVTIFGRNIDRLTALLRDVLDSARLQSPGLATARMPLDLGTLVDESMHDMAAVFQEAGVGLARAGPPSAPVLGDGMRLRQLLHNLLDNALKYTPRGGKVVVEIRATRNSWAIAVKDSGEGIAHADTGRLFQPFARVGDTSSHPGTGLGLYICRAIAEKHGGTLEVQSQGTGSGSTFTLTLPADNSANLILPTADAAPSGNTVGSVR